MSEFEASYGDILQCKETGLQYEVIDWFNDDGGTEYTLKDVLNDRVVMMTGDELIKPSDKRKLLSIKDIDKIKADAVREDILNCETHWSDNLGDEVYLVSDIKELLDKLERGEI